MIQVVRAGSPEPDATPRQREFVALGPHAFTRVSYVEWGSPNAQRTVICLHGLTRNGRDFDYLARRLVKKGMRVVAPDLPGRGHSAPMANWHDYGTPLYLAVMAGLIARLDVEEVDWVGTSLGGHIGMEFAAHAGAPIRRLVLNDFGARIAARALQRISAYLTADTGRTFASIEEIDEHLREILEPFGDLTDEQWRHLAVHGAVEVPGGRWRLRHDPAISKTFWWPIVLDIVLWQVWDKVECPTLILRGVHSDLLSAETVRLMTRRGAAAKRGVVRSVDVPACGHAPALMEDSQTDVVAEFLLADDTEVQGKPARAVGSR
jgi:pimeloyl-ACP methyl ester carboxylesterase